MSDKFVEGLPGLQIDWEDYSEVECLGLGVLNGTSKFTEAQCVYGGRIRVYVYRVHVTRQESKIEIEYEREPTTWPKNWGMYKGTLTVFLADKESSQPSRVTWQIRGESEPEELVHGKNWIFYPEEKVGPVNVVPRGKLKTSKLARPKQQKMRNQLISMYGGCMVTGVETLEALEACHIVPVKNNGDDSIQNSLLLRRDLHALFDARLLMFVERGGTWTIEIDRKIEDKLYRGFDGQRLREGVSKLHSLHFRARNKLEKEE